MDARTAWLDRWSGSIEARNATVKHAAKAPVDDRPSYLADGPYRVAVDTETTGLDWFDDHRPFIATASDYDRDYLFVLDRPDDTRALRELLLETADELIFHNASFDVHMLVAQGVVTLEEILAVTIHDTRLLAPIVVGSTIPGGMHLKNLATLFVDPAAKDAENVVLDRMVEMGLIQKRDQQRKPDGAYYAVWRAHPKDLEDYALYDTRCTYDLFHVLARKADEMHAAEVKAAQPGDIVVHPMEVYELSERGYTMPALIRMEDRGFRVHRGRVASLVSEFEADVAGASDRLAAFNGGEAFNPDARTELLPVLEANGVRITERTEKSNETRTDRWILEKYRHLAPDLVDAILDYRTHDKVLTTFLYPMRDRDAAHPDIRQSQAWTARMACARPNMQNIPVRKGPEARSMFIPRDGMALVVADYSSIELRLLDVYMGPGNVLEDLLAAGEDPFLWLGAQVFGDDQSKWPVSRSALKNGFYAMTYGAGGPRFAKTVGGGLTDDDGRAIISSIKGALGQPFKDLNAALRRKVMTRGYVKTLAGRRQHVARDKSYVALNAVIQGSAAEVMKRAIAELERRRTGARSTPTGHPLERYHMLIPVHDEIVGEVPVEQAEEALAAVQDAMRAPESLDPTGRLVLKTEGVVCLNNYGEAK